MIFQVIRNGAVMMWTEHDDCVPDKETCINMQKTGYILKLNGKIYNPKLPKELKYHNPITLKASIALPGVTSALHALSG